MYGFEVISYDVFSVIEGTLMNKGPQCGIYNLNPCYCGEFYMMMSVLWSSSYEGA